MGGLGSFAGGVSQGLSQGQDIRARQMQLQDAARQRAANEAVSNWLQAEGAAGANDNGGLPTAVPIPGASPMPGSAGPIAAAPQGPPAMPPPQGGPAQMSPGGPAPQPMGPRPAPQGPQAMPPQAMPAPQGGPTPMPPGGPAPGGGAPPGAGPSPAPAPQPDGMSGAASPSGDVWADSKKTIQSVARSIAQSNPGRKWKPGELLDAVNTSVKLMNGLNPLERTAAQAQIAGAKAQYEYWEGARKSSEADANRSEKGRESDQRADTAKANRSAAWDRAKLSSDTKIKSQSMADATRLQAEELIQGGANARASNLLQFKQEALNAGLNEKVWQAQLAAYLKEQGMSDNFIVRLFSAENMSAEPGKTPPAPERPKVGAAPAPPKVGEGPVGGPVKVGGGPVGGPVKVKTPVEANKLKPGTHYVTPDGKEFIR